MALRPIRIYALQDRYGATRHDYGRRLAVEMPRLSKAEMLVVTRAGRTLPHAHAKKPETLGTKFRCPDHFFIPQKVDLEPSSIAGRLSKILAQILWAKKIRRAKS